MKSSNAFGSHVRLHLSPRPQAPEHERNSVHIAMDHIVAHLVMSIDVQCIILFSSQEWMAMPSAGIPHQNMC